MPAIPDFARDDLDALGLEMPEPLLERLARFLDLLLEANQRVNLTAVREREPAWRRLILDSLTVLPGLEPIEEPGRVIDIGTGGGLPGVPAAIARPDLRFTLLDSTGKKVRFLEQLVRDLPLPNVHPLHKRAEQLGRDPAHREQYDATLSRAVGPVAEVLEYSLPLTKAGGRVLAMKGVQAEPELKAAGDALELLGGGDLQVIEAYPPEFARDLVILSILKEHPTPTQYPRRPGLPRHEPL